jgi:hypothetical protein
MNETNEKERGDKQKQKKKKSKRESKLTSSLPSSFLPRCSTSIPPTQTLPRAFIANLTLCPMIVSRRDVNSAVFPAPSFPRIINTEPAGQWMLMFCTAHPLLLLLEVEEEDEEGRE